MAIPVRLSTWRLLTGAIVGVERCCQALMEEREPQHGADPESLWQLHVEGALGESAYFQFRGASKLPTVGVYKGEHDAGKAEVRTRSRHDWELIVRQRDPIDAFYVLVTGSYGDYLIHGYISGEEARQDQWVKTHGGRSPAWFVPQSALTPFPEDPDPGHIYQPGEAAQ